MLGFRFIHGGEKGDKKDRERQRDKNERERERERERTEMVLGNIFYRVGILF